MFVWLLICLLGLWYNLVVVGVGVMCFGCCAGLPSKIVSVPCLGVGGISKYPQVVIRVSETKIDGKKWHSRIWTRRGFRSGSD